MIFRDASAILPLGVQEDPSPLVQDVLLCDPAMVVPIRAGLGTRQTFLGHKNGFSSTQ